MGRLTILGIPKWISIFETKHDVIYIFDVMDIVTKFWFAVIWEQYSISKFKFRLKNQFYKRDDMEDVAFN